ncbi:TMEM165/GDT1 family protein [Nocardioides sp. KIGAM211]|uniref:GDT1 family protein n=1 Tax=Nocardioides luti TaxID=2761101 RepID=A0A7X0VBC2_9ACTN|nr:TMEM165/GDT1 family protein [Nocardioides luti]MBB6627837.1 TMEM165/GDT1 family protein [Nocardioides luti]
MDIVVIALTFAAIFVVELPDKTFVATLVLATKYRPLLVWIGVGLAFTVQTIVAVALGHAVTFLPEDLVRGVAGVIFLAGAVLLFREGRSHHLASEDEEAFAAKATAATGWKAVLTCFLILFAAEWGDLSQLLTISLVAKYEDPVSVFIGALGALLTVSGLAAVSGRALMKKIPLHALHYVGAAVCLLLAAVTAYELLA